MLFGIFIVDKQFAVLAVAMRFLTGNRNNIKDTTSLVEDGIHLLQGSVGGFGIEEVDDREDESVT